MLMLASSVLAKTPFPITFNSTEETLVIYWDDSLIFERFQLIGKVLEINSPYQRSDFNVTSGYELNNLLPGETVEIFINATIGNEIYEALIIARTGFFLKQNFKF